MKKNRLVIGFVLIMLGLLMLLKPIFQINIFDMEHFWPIFVLAPGLIFEMSFFVGRSNSGLLVPGGILTTIGVLFYFETFTNWNFSEYTWPVYILAVAIGLFQLYYFGGKAKGLLIPVGILTTVALVSFGSMIFGNLLYWVNSSIIIAGIFILLGVFILIKSYFTH